MKTLILVITLIISCGLSFSQENSVDETNTTTGLSEFHGVYRFVYNGESRIISINAAEQSFEEYKDGVKVGYGVIDFQNGTISPFKNYEGSAIRSQLNFSITSSAQNKVVVEIQSSEGPISIEFLRVNN